MNLIQSQPRQRTKIMKRLLAFITLFSVTSLVVVAAAADQRPLVDPELHMDPVSGLTLTDTHCRMTLRQRKPLQTV